MLATLALVASVAVTVHWLHTEYWLQSVSTFYGIFKILKGFSVTDTTCMLFKSVSNRQFESEIVSDAPFDVKDMLLTRSRPLMADRS